MRLYIRQYFASVVGFKGKVFTDIIQRFFVTVQFVVRVVTAAFAHHYLTAVHPHTVLLIVLGRLGRPWVGADCGTVAHFRLFVTPFVAAAAFYAQLLPHFGPYAKSVVLFPPLP